MSVHTEQAVIDICDGVHDAASWLALLRGLSADAPHFLEFLAGAMSVVAGLDPARTRDQLARDPAQALAALAGGLAVGDGAHVARLRAAGVRHQVLHGSPYRLPGGESVNDRVAARAARYPDLLRGWCGVDARDPAAALAEIDRCVALGMSGVVMLPFAAGVPAGDPAAHVIYRHVADLGLPLWLHCGLNLSRTSPMTTPAELDLIAGRYPRMPVVAGHGGWPYVGELVAVMMRQPNVYLDTSGHDPRAMAAAGSGWEPMLLHLRGALRRRVVFGSAAWTHASTQERSIAAVRGLGLEERHARAWLHDNAAALLGLPLAITAPNA
ncbi:amidohydrolase family protein [Nonomuraea typhae]|uniref:amidohydrolase family protein n=1 Tax=Nonomuraea typhae TaxID=2603600 RepID=UPI0012FA6EEB|nr:amidohydrolase family protein [Nonomuraea typhae]